MKRKEEDERQVFQKSVENVALLYIEEKTQNEVLRKEVSDLSKQLHLRKYTTRKGFAQLKCDVASEFLASKLRSCLQIGHLTHLGIDVAIKHIKGSSLNVEGRVYQA